MRMFCSRAFSCGGPASTNRASRVRAARSREDIPSLWLAFVL
jgi:hypothetical protein